MKHFFFSEKLYEFTSYKHDFYHLNTHRMFNYLNKNNVKKKKFSIRDCVFEYSIHLKQFIILYDFEKRILILLFELIYSNILLNEIKCVIKR